MGQLRTRIIVKATTHTHTYLFRDPIYRSHISLKKKNIAI